MNKTFFNGSGGFYFAINGKETYAWGFNRENQLGLGISICTLRNPRLLVCPDGSHWIDFHCGYSHVIGVTFLGNVYVWGSNQYGKLGLNKLIDEKITPHLWCSSDDNIWRKFVCRMEYTVALTLTGDMYAWGLNKHGQLGIGKPYYVEYKDTPQQLKSDIQWKDIACGSYFVIALSTTGRLFSWGANGNGELGLGNVDRSLIRYVPEEIVVVDVIWEKIFCGDYHTIAITSHGLQIIHLL